MAISTIQHSVVVIGAAAASYVHSTRCRLF